MKEIVNRLRDHGTDFVDAGKLLLAGGGNPIERGKMLCQNVRHAIAHVRDAKAGKKAIQAFGAAVFDVGDHFVGDFFADGAGKGFSFLLDLRIDVGDVAGLELVEIGKGFHQTALNELIDQHIADSLDIHLCAAAEPAEALLHLRGTGGIRAVDVDARIQNLHLFATHRAFLGEICPLHLLALIKRIALRIHAAIAAHFFGEGLAFHFCAAFGAFTWSFNRLCAPRPLLLHHLDDIRNDFARALHHHRIPIVHAQPLDLIDVVQRDVSDGYAADEDRLEVADGRELAALADLPAHILQHRRLLLGLVLVGDYPARGFAGRPQLLALLERIDFEHNAVGHERQLGPDLFKLVNALDRLVDAFDAPNFPGQGQAPFAHELRQFPIPLSGQRLDLAEAVGEEAQAALGHDFGIEAAQRAGGEIAGIGIGLFAFLDDLLVDALKVFVVHVDFAADFQNLRRFHVVITKRKRYRSNRPGVDGDVIADVAPAAGCGEHESAFFVSQADRRAVDFRFDHIGNPPTVEQSPSALFHSQSLSHALIKGADFLFAVGVVD